MASANSNRNGRTVAAVAYYRMSSKKQDKSIPAQSDEVDRYAKANGYRLVRWKPYVDEGISGSDYDRVILDLPEPWEVVPHAAQALHAGGIIVAYTPSIVQATRFRTVLDEYGFRFAETVEVLNRTWHVDGDAVRPDHRMVAHTAFLTHARLLVP